MALQGPAVALGEVIWDKSVLVDPAVCGHESVRASEMKSTCLGVCRRLIISLVGVGIGALVGVAPAQTECDWLPGECVPGMGSDNPYDYVGVHALTIYNGELIAGGHFTTAGGVPCSHIARWDGSVWQPLGSGMAGGYFTVVYALTVYNGELIAGGWFTTAGGVPCNDIARWDGSNWQPLGSGMSGGTYETVVLALTIYGGELIAGGDFATAGDATCNGIARWDGNIWQALGSGISGGDYSNVAALTVYNAELIAGGLFTTAGDVTCNNIARWDGSAWQPLGSGIAGGWLASGAVQAVTVYNGELIAGGDFDTAGDVPCASIAGWDGSIWHPLGLGMWGRPGMPGRPAVVSALTTYKDDLFAGGSIWAADAVECNNIARWDGNGWQPVGSGRDVVVGTLALYSGELIAGSYVSLWGSDAPPPFELIARWNGSIWQPLGAGMEGDVHALTVYNGELIAGGHFTIAGGVSCNSIGRWDGSSWHALGSGMGPPSSPSAPWTRAVFALTTYNGELIAGGDFETAGGVTCNSIARWNGADWQPLGAGMGGYSSVYALTVYNGELIAGGDFTTAGGVTCNRIARWDGATWQPLGSGMDGCVRTLLVYNGELITGGDFTTAGGVTCNSIARWDGSSWQPLGLGMNGPVRALTVAWGLVVAGGTFSTAGGVPCNNIARWYGTYWQPLGSGMDGSVSALTVFNYELIVGGGFTTANGVACNYIARFDGGIWHALGSGMSGGDTYDSGTAVLTLAAYNTGLIAGGNFTVAGEHVSAYWARWGCLYPLGDLNCDGAVEFGDINPFVLYLSNNAAWQAEFPGCPPENGDINGDGTYGQWSFDDINPFVELLFGG
jgi:hypothetical protein